MKIAIFSLTRDRLPYTQLCFERLREAAGHPFDHFVLDNGSQDGTREWLLSEYAHRRIHSLELLPDNSGISEGSNDCLRQIWSAHRWPGVPDGRCYYDLIIKFDNDCWVESEDILSQIVEIYEDMRTFDPVWILSPRVEGLIHQPERVRDTMRGERRIGVTGIVGGLFQCVPARVYRKYRYPESLPLAKGQDDHFCHWAQVNGARLGYIEDLVVHHHETTNGQRLRFPEYFERKRKEERHAAKDDKEATAENSEAASGSGS